MFNKIFFRGLILFAWMVPVCLCAQETCAIVLNADNTTDTINRNIYGNFSEHLGHCIYGGIWVGENSPVPNTRGIRNDVVSALRRLNLPILRWPGGCFADEYHWMDGIGPRDKRPKMINTHWGGVVEDNSFGTHEFLDLCEQIGAEPYISGNVGSGSVEEMSKWIEYITFDGQSPMAELRRQNGRDKPWKVRFWGVGNENWGCGGNMTAEFYADQFRRYSTYCRNYGNNQLYKIAGGPNAGDYQWMATLMKNIPPYMLSGVSLHYYTVSGTWDKKGSSTNFTEGEYFSTLKNTLYMEELISRQSSIMDQYDPQRRIGLIVDEWGNWHDVEPGTNPGFLYQQNTLRDALVAGINLNIFNNHCGRVKGANIAQMVNVLQSIILTEGDKMILTPTYYVFEMYKVHQQAALIPVELKSPVYGFDGETIPAVTVSASKDKKGRVHITFTQADPHNEVEIDLEIRGDMMGNVKGTVLSSNELNAHNTFDSPEKITAREFRGASLSKNRLTVTLPPASVVMIEMF